MFCAVMPEKYPDRKVHARPAKATVIRSSMITAMIGVIPFLIFYLLSISIRASIRELKIDPLEPLVYYAQAREARLAHLDILLVLLYQLVHLVHEGLHDVLGYVRHGLLRGRCLQYLHELVHAGEQLVYLARNLGNLVPKLRVRLYDIIYNPLVGLYELYYLLYKPLGLGSRAGPFDLVYALFEPS